MAAGPPKTSDYRNVQVSVDRRGLATAIVGGFLAIGRDSGVRAVIDAQSGAPGTGSLADDPKASAARDALPAERLADAYLSPDGIAKLVGNPRGPLATLDAAVDPTASDGVAIALVADDQGINVDIRSELDEARAKAQPGFFAAFPEFEPTLTGSLPAGSLAYAGIADPGHALVSLLAQASANQPGLAAGVATLVSASSSSARSTWRRSCFRRSAMRLPLRSSPRRRDSDIPYLEFLSTASTRSVRTERSRASKARSPTRSTPRQARRRASARARWMA